MPSRSTAVPTAALTPDQTAARIDPPIALAWRPAEVEGSGSPATFGFGATSLGNYAAGVADEVPHFRGALWRSDDGTRWHAISGPAEWQDVQLSDVAEAEGRLVAAGTHVVELISVGGGLTASRVEASLWWSDDGSFWPQAVVDVPGAILTRVKAGGGAFVAAGSYAPDKDRQCLFPCAPGVSVLSSSFGVGWETRVLDEDPELAFVGLGHSDSSGWVAMARDGEVPPSGTVLWQSIDGIEWSRHDGPAGLDAWWLSGVSEAVDGGLIAVAEVGQSGPAPTVFFSTDGLTWTAAPRGTPGLSGISRIAGGYVGWNNSLESADYGVWTSLDGVEWGQTEAYNEFYSDDMAQLGGVVASTCSAAFDGSPICFAPAD